MGKETIGIPKMVSVIVPTHNSVVFLQRALLSIINQSYPLIEIIVIANGRSEQTKKSVNGIKRSHQRLITLLNSQSTVGAAKARNIGIDQARGEYIAFLDGDDYWHPDKLQTQVQLLNQHACSIVGTRYFFVYNTEQQRTTKHNSRSGQVELNDMRYNNVLGGCSCCLTKKAFIGTSRISEDLTAGQDWDLWLKVLSNTGLPAYISPQHQVYYCVDDSKIVTNYQQQAESYKRFLHYWETTLKDKRVIDYHKIRIRCYQIKALGSGKLYPYLANLGFIIKTAVANRSGYSFRDYLYYLSLPLLNITAARRWIQHKKIKAVTRTISRLHTLKYTVYHWLKRSSGVNSEPRNIKLLVSLTSYKPRLETVFLTIESLLAQTFKPDKIVLWLSATEIKAAELPNSLVNLKARGLEIRWVDENVKSYKKLVYVAENFSDYHCVTCDDDLMYPSWFLHDLHASYQQHPECISAYRCRAMNKIDNNQLLPYNQWLFHNSQVPSYNVFSTNGGGTWYPPNTLSKQITDRVFMTICPSADDVWFKAMSLLNHTKTVMVKPESIDFTTIYANKSQADTLWATNSKTNDQQLKAVFEHFKLYDMIA